MTATPKQLSQFGVTQKTPGKPQYTCPTGTTTRIEKITFSNVSGASATVSVYVVPNGMAPQAAYLLTPGATVAANAVYTATEAAWHNLKAGDSLYLVASNVAVNSMASGTEFT